MKNVKLISLILLTTSLPLCSCNKFSDFSTPDTGFDFGLDNNTGFVLEDPTPSKGNGKDNTKNNDSAKDVDGSHDEEKKEEPKDVEPEVIDIDTKEDPTKKTYYITFIVEGVEETKQYNYNDIPDYGFVPEKAETPEYTYTFSKWEPEITKVTEDTSYTAVFEAKKRKYDITFVVENKPTTLSVEYGQMPNYGSTPEKAAQGDFKYEFSKWEPSLRAVDGPETYTAVFTEVNNTSLITFVIDGKSEQVKYVNGVLPTPETPTKTSTAEYNYTFSRWDPALQVVNGPKTYTAVFTSTRRKYSIKFNIDGVTYQTSTLEYGQTPSFSNSKVAINNTKKELKISNETHFPAYYSITGSNLWSPSITSVRGNQTYVAQVKRDTDNRSFWFHCWSNDSLPKDDFYNGRFFTLTTYVGPGEYIYGFMDAPDPSGKGTTQTIDEIKESNKVVVGEIKEDKFLYFKYKGTNYKLYQVPHYDEIARDSDAW